jgi:hypothetical protein
MKAGPGTPLKVATFPPVKWKQASTKNLSPFENSGSITPLRMSFHLESFQALTRSEMLAVALLRSFCKLTPVHLTEMNGKGESRFEVGELTCPPACDDSMTEEMEIGVPAMESWRPQFEQKLVDEKLTKHSISDLLKDHFVVRGQLQRADLFVTGSRRLLRLQKKMGIADTNGVGPMQAAAIAGLFLRAQGNFCVAVEPRQRTFVSETDFYWVLAGSWLTNYWPLISCCVSRGCKGRGQARKFASGIMERCCGTLRARDLVIRRLYQKRTHDTMANAYFYFEYMCILLSGAMDSLASLIAIGCDYVNSGGRYPSFRSKDFLHSIGAKLPVTLRKVFSSPGFSSLLSLLYEPRNMIHSEGMTPVTVMGKSSGMFHRMHPSMLASIRSAARAVSSCEEWGVDDDGHVDIFKYSQALVQESFHLMNQVTGLLDMAMFLKPGSAPLTVPSTLPMFGRCGPIEIQGICILGGIEPPETPP